MPPISTSPLVGSSRLPAIVSSVDLPEPLGPMTATMLAASHRQVHPAQRVHLGGPRRRTSSTPTRISSAAHRRTPTRRRSLGRRPAARSGCSSAAARLRRPSAASSHRMTASSRNSSASTTRARLTSNSASSSLMPGPLLHQLDQVPAVHLDHVVHVGAGHPHRHQDLHHQLIARRRGQVGWRAQPGGQLGRPVLGDPEALLRPLVRVVVGLDQPVALQPLQGLVHLAHVQRPHLAGPRLELLAQLQPVLRAPR